MIRALLITAIFIVQEEPPFKQKEEFEIKFDLSFKNRTHDTKTVHVSETRAEHDKRLSTTPLPYLNLHVKILTHKPEEIKIKVVKDDQNTVYNKKLVAGMEFRIDVGFTDDLKDRISGYKHVIQFLSTDKNVLSIILIEFDKDGNYMVNGEKRGKI
jgi:hypothetical protein